MRMHSAILLRMSLSEGGPLAEHEWPAVRGLLHRTFANEPFTVEMYGQSLLDRWGDSWGLYSSVQSADYTLALGLRLRDVLVGVALGSIPGHCHLCEVLALEARPDDPHLAIEWEFNQNIAQQHDTLGKHAWITKVAVEPALQGQGIGRRLFESADDALKAMAPTELVLECAPHRLTFYRGLGYDQVATFADPAGPDASLMRRWIR